MAESVDGMENNNPYAPPRAPVEIPDGPPSATSAPLYSIGQLMLGAFLGSLFASAWMARSNFKAIGQPVKARKTLWWGAVGSLVGLGIAVLLPDRVPNIAIPAVTMFLVRALASRHLERTLDEHFKANGQMRSWWGVVGISLVSGLLLFAAGMFAFACWAFGYYLITGKTPQL